MTTINANNKREREREIEAEKNFYKKAYLDLSAAIKHFDSVKTDMEKEWAAQDKADDPTPSVPTQKVFVVVTETGEDGQNAFKQLPQTDLCMTEEEAVQKACGMEAVKGWLEMHDGPVENIRTTDDLENAVNFDYTAIMVQKFWINV